MPFDQFVQLLANDGGIGAGVNQLALELRAGFLAALEHDPQRFPIRLGVRQLTPKVGDFLVLTNEPRFGVLFGRGQGALEFLASRRVLGEQLRPIRSERVVRCTQQLVRRSRLRELALVIGADPRQPRVVCGADLRESTLVVGTELRDPGIALRDGVREALLVFSNRASQLRLVVSDRSRQQRLAFGGGAGQLGFVIDEGLRELRFQSAEHFAMSALLFLQRDLLLLGQRPRLVGDQGVVGGAERFPLGD